MVQEKALPIDVSQLGKKTIQLLLTRAGFSFLGTFSAELPSKEAGFSFAPEPLARIMSDPTYTFR